jgi:hypothetical protein
LEAVACAILHSASLVQGHIRKSNFYGSSTGGEKKIGIDGTYTDILLYQEIYLMTFEVLATVRSIFLVVTYILENSTSIVEERAFSIFKFQL